MNKFVFSNNSGTIRLTVTTDQILTSQNDFTIMAVSGTSTGPLDSNNIHGENFFWSTFKRGMKTTIDAFVTFATTYGLNLTQITSNSSSAIQLVILGSQS